MGIIEDALADFVVNHFEEEYEEVEELKKDLRELRSSVKDIEEKVDKLFDEEEDTTDGKKTTQKRVTKRTLTSIRDRFDLTQTELADLLDVSSGSITSWETGKSKPSKSNKEKIIELREKSKDEVDEMLDREEESEESVDVRAIRDEHGLTQKEFAEQLGVSPTTVSNWEQGNSQPSSDKLERIRNIDDQEDEAIRDSVRVIQYIRDRFDLTQKELADLLDVSSATIGSWERGDTTPQRDNKERILSLKDKSEEEILDELDQEDEVDLDIGAIREKLSLTRSEFADRIDVSVQTVYNWEEGDTQPGSENMERIQNLRDQKGSGDKESSSEVSYTGKNIKQLRDEKGLSQAELAEQLDVSPGTISNWERGEGSPSEEAVEKLQEV